MERWKIWATHFNPNGSVRGSIVAAQTYAHKSSAVRAAKKCFGTDPTKCKWIVSQTNPHLSAGGN